MLQVYFMYAVINPVKLQRVGLGCVCVRGGGELE